MDEKRIREVFSDEAFVKSLFEMENPEDVQAAIKEKGLDFTLDDIHKLRESLLKMPTDGGELTAEDLDEVAGGELIVLGALAAITVIGGVFAGTAYSLVPVVKDIRQNRW